MTTERGHVPTKKGEEFIAAFKRFCKEQNIREEEITKFLACVVDADSEYISWGDAFKDLVERGYLTKRELKTVSAKNIFPNSKPVGDGE